MYSAPINMRPSSSRTDLIKDCRLIDTALLGVERVSLGAQTAGSRGVLLEVAAEGRGQEGTEDEIGAPGRW